MGFPTVDRYSDLIQSIVAGSFYESSGITVPFRSDASTLRIETSSANTEFGIYINDVYAGSEISDLSGNLVVNKFLPLGEVVISLYNSQTGKRLDSYVTVREYALWLASYADVLEQIDANIDQVREDISIKTASLAMLQDFYGKTVETYADIGQSEDAYRWQVHELRQAYRDAGACFGGLEDAVSAFTQVPPFGYSRRKWGPNWVLDQNMLVNHRFKDRSHGFASVGLLNFVTGVDLVSAEADVSSAFGNMLWWDHVARTLTWYPNLVAGVATPVREGLLFLPGPPQTKYARVLSQVGTFNIQANTTDRLFINVDNQGIVTVPLTLGVRTAANIAADINTAFSADVRYGMPVAFVYNSKVCIEGGFFPNTNSVEICHDVCSASGRNAAALIFGAGTGNIVLGTGNPNCLLYGFTLVSLTGRVDQLDRQITLIHTYVEATDTHQIGFQNSTAPYAISPAVTVTGSGTYVMTDVTPGVGTQLTVFVDFEELSVGSPTLMEIDTFYAGYSQIHCGLRQNQGLWVDVVLDDLPVATSVNGVDVLDDYSEGWTNFVETPDNWSIHPVMSSAISTTTFEPSDLIAGRADDYGPCEAFALHYTNSDVATTSVDFIAHVDKFPFIQNTPRGSNFPQQGPGKFYDYEGFAFMFDAWARSAKNGTTVSPSISFDGGDTWVSDPLFTVALTQDSAYRDSSFNVWYYGQIPAEISRSASFTDAGVLVKLTFARAAGQLDILIDGTSFGVEFITSRSLGNSTVLRDRHRQYFGELVWVWSPEALSIREKKYLGIQHKTSNKTAVFGGITVTSISTDTPNGNGSFQYEYHSTGSTKRVRWEPSGTAFAPGLGWVSLVGDGPYTITAPDGSFLTISVIYSHVPVLVSSTMPVTRSATLTISDSTVDQGHARSIAAAHSSVDVCDATEYDSNGDPLNLFGAITETDFSMCGLVNCGIASIDPYKYSYIYPEFSSQVGEILTLAPSGPDWLATLGYYSDQDQTAAVLYEDGLPVPNNMWSFSAANEISIPNSFFASGALSHASVFTLDYDLLYQVETSILDLGVDYEDYAWLADYYLWERNEAEQGSYYAEVPVFFNRDTGRAFLTTGSDQNKATSTLVSQQAFEEFEISKVDWKFIDSRTIEIASSYLVPGQYVLKHYETKVYEHKNLTVVFEHKSGAAPGALGSYSTLERNENVSTIGSQRYHQLRISISGVRDLQDFKLRSLVLKGLHIHGSNQYLEGLTNVWNW
jgi:hypothetical protein